MDFIKELFYKKSREKVVKVADSNSADTSFLLQKAISAQSSGQHLQVIKVCDKIIKYDSMNLEAYYIRGRAQSTLGDWDGAIEDYIQ